MKSFCLLIIGLIIVIKGYGQYLDPGTFSSLGSFNPSSNVVIDMNTLSMSGGISTTGVVSGDILVFTFANFTLSGGLSISFQNVLDNNKKVAFLSQGDMTISGSILASAGSYIPGPGGGRGGRSNPGLQGENGQGTGGGVGDLGGGGGGHGGAGGDAGMWADGGVAYGNLTVELSGGSGGGASDESTTGFDGGGGGGGIELGAYGTITLNSGCNIEAKGKAGTGGDENNDGCGGGSGGGILIHSNSIVNNAGALISTRGGKGGSGFGMWMPHAEIPGTYASGGGGGGRVLLAYHPYGSESSINSGSIDIAGGLGGAHQIWTPGEPGSQGVSSFISDNSVPIGPEINIKGNDTNIANGHTSPSLSDHTDFGETPIDGGTIIRTFTIHNIGNYFLTSPGLNSVELSSSAAFSVSSQPSSEITPGESSPFSITFNPSATGTHSTTISIANSDRDENPYTFTIQGSGTEVASVSSQEVSNLSSTAAIGNGNITSLGYPNPSAHGVCWNTSTGPTILNSKTDKGASSSTGAFTASVSGLSAGTTYYLRAFATNTAGTVYGEEISFTTTNIWDGSESSDWNTAGNWLFDAVPLSSDHVEIPDLSVDPIISSTTAVCQNLSIKSDASLSLAIGKSLTVNGDLSNSGILSVQSDASSSGSLMVKGSSSGNIIYKRYMTGIEKWHLISAPVEGQNMSDFITAAGNKIAYKNPKYAFTDYNEESNNWSNYCESDVSGSFTVGKGYEILRSEDGVVTFTGTVRTTDVSIGITRSGNGWNVLGNPFPSSINATTSADETNTLLNTSNIDNLEPSFAALYLWDPISSSFKTINNSGATNPSGTLNQNYIAPGQGFFIRSKDNSSRSFSITENMQSHQPDVPFKSTQNCWPFIQLKIERDGVMSNTIIGFNENMTLGLDISYDAGLHKTNSDVALYSRLIEDNGVDFAIQCLPIDDLENISIPIGIDVSENDNYTFSLHHEMMDWCPIFLIDSLEKTFTNLKEDTYSTVISENSIGRFFIQFKTPITTGIKEKTKLKIISLYGHDGQLNISNPQQEKGIVNIYNLAGAEVHSFTLSTDHNQEYICDLISNFYIVRIRTDRGEYSKIIYLR